MAGPWRVHGEYGRVVADGAAGGRPVLIALSVRRFRCPEPSCLATFAEQAGAVSERYRRRSVPLLGMLAGFGLELAGRTAARLADTLGVPVHSSTVLRLVMALPDPSVTAAPEVTWVDDFAMRELTPAQADDLYELTGGSLVLTSNRAPQKAHMFAATCARYCLK